MKAREFDEKVAMIKETMAAYGITTEDLQGKSAKASRTKSSSPAPAKYTGPNGESWSGRGLAPKWLTALIAEGHAKDEYLINK